jgi:hypothetical protein
MFVINIIYRKNIFFLLVMDKSRRNYKYYRWSFYVVINSIVLVTNIQMFVGKGTAGIIPSKKIIFVTKNISISDNPFARRK